MPKVDARDKPEGKREGLVRQISVRNLLSFGHEGICLDLGPLNLLIGPNGSGKSNLMEAISLLQAAPTHLAAPVRDGGGIRDWIWKGEPGATATLEAVVDNPDGNQPLRHTIEFVEQAQTFMLVDERIENTEPYEGHTDTSFYYRFQRGRPALSVKNLGRRSLRIEDVSRDESILSQRKDPDQYPELTYLGQVYGRIRLYREWSFGRYSVPRQPQKVDQRNDHLEPDCSNLGLVLNRLRRDSRAKREILENLRQLYEGIEDYDFSVQGGTIQVFLQESGFDVPATRLSDGTLRYLCLLAVLCDPVPPPLVCIEEPELGLHPDLMPTIARLLKHASERTQLVVTTHSDILIDEFTEQPEAVIVCEKHQRQTTMKRLDSESLAEWLGKYRLGQLWTRGQVGGVRW